VHGGMLFIFGFIASMLRYRIAGMILNDLQITEVARRGMILPFSRSSCASSKAGRKGSPIS
jgi:hypothetical protein